MPILPTISATEPPRLPMSCCRTLTRSIGFVTITCVARVIQTLYERPNKLQAVLSSRVPYLSSRTGSSQSPASHAFYITLYVFTTSVRFYITSWRYTSRVATWSLPYTSRIALWSPWASRRNSRAALGAGNIAIAHRRARALGAAAQPSAAVPGGVRRPRHCVLSQHARCAQGRAARKPRARKHACRVTAQMCVGACAGKLAQACM